MAMSSLLFSLLSMTFVNIKKLKGAKDPTNRYEYSQLFLYFANGLFIRLKLRHIYPSTKLSYNRYFHMYYLL